MSKKYLVAIHFTKNFRIGEPIDGFKILKVKASSLKDSFKKGIKKLKRKLHHNHIEINSMISAPKNKCAYVIKIKDKRRH